MRSVRMKFSFVGYRFAGGPAWPAYNELLYCGDAEAEKLVNAGHAVYLEDEQEPLNAGFNALSKWVDSYDPALDPENRKDDELDLSEYDEPEDNGPKRPYTNAKKEDWIEYAVAKGTPREQAERMSKADLISQHGASI